MMCPRVSCAYEVVDPVMSYTKEVVSEAPRTAEDVDIVNSQRLKEPVKESDTQIKVTPVDLAGDGVINESCFYTYIRLFLWVVRALGRMPYTISDDGWMKFSYFSLPFLYALLILILNVALHVYYHTHLERAFYDLSEALTFSRILFSSMTILQSIGLWMTVFSWIFECPCIVRNYNTAALLERKLADVFPTCSYKPRMKQAFVIFLSLYFVGLVIIATILLILRFKHTPVPILMLFVFNFVGNQSYTVMWCTNNLFIRSLAIKLREYMVKSFHHGHNRAQKIRTGRKAWLSIWDQAQKNTFAFSTTVIWCLISYGITLVTSAYGILVSVRAFDIDEVFHTLPYFATSYLLVASIMESTHQAKYKLGDEFLLMMIHLEKEDMDRECLEEVDRFTHMILQTDKAQFTLKGYLIIGRPLLVSFLSYTATYLIVLLQFRQSEEQAHEKFNGTQLIGRA